MFEYDYLQAKLHGIHSKSIVGDNYEKLMKIKSIEKVHKELFPDDTDFIVKENLFSYLEKKFKKKIFKQINFVSKFYNYKNRFVNNLILRYEIDNVKLIVNSYYRGLKRFDDFFEIDLADTLDYKLIKSKDLSSFESIKEIFQNTVFSFLLPLLQDRKDVFYIENYLDKFYYNNLIDSLKILSFYEKNLLLNIIKEEMNWQNISWAFRTKIHYAKSFANIKDTFLDFKGLIPIDAFENIFNLQFLPNEANKLLDRFPLKYKNIILESFSAEGDFNLHLLEQSIIEELTALYSRYFFIENFNILPIISFIYIKKSEYYNVVKIIESIRYNIE